MGQNYTTQIRLLLCQNCGGPLEARPTGGLVACGYCRAQNQITSRRDDAALSAPSFAPVDEPERIRRLREQDGRRPVAPPSLQALLALGGGFVPAKLEEAFHVYAATRREVEATHSPESAERLFFLTLVADTHLTRINDHVRRRAVLETSLETLALPRHRQVLRATLATAAAKEGDLASADEWLAPCNPRSEDISADTAYRVAHAFTATVAQNWARALAMLGAVEDAYPIDDTWDATATLLRANALERTGDVERAVSALRTRMARSGAEGRYSMESTIEAHRELSLCPVSFERAKAGHREVAAAHVGHRRDGGQGAFFLMMGVGLICVALALPFLVAAPSVISGIASGGPEAALFGLAEGIVSGGVGGGIGCCALFVWGFAFAVAGVVLRKRAKAATWLRLNGVSAIGVVCDHRVVGTTKHGRSTVEVTLEVRHPDRPPYQVSSREPLDAQLQRFLVVGAEVPIRVHPDRPQEIVLEID